MKVLPLIYIEHFTEEERLQHECSDRIWFGRDTFERFMNDVEPGVANMLELINGVDQRVVGCIYGIHYADENILYVPQWMYDELLLEDEHITVNKTSPGMCTGLMLQPHTSEHVRAVDPQEMLREAFEQYSCLIPGTTIPLWIDSLKTQVTVTIMEVRPNTGEIRSIRNCEIELELMPPLDMPLPPVPAPAEQAQEEPQGTPLFPTAVAPFATAGKGYVVDSAGGAAAPKDEFTRRLRAASAARKRLKAAQENITNDAKDSASTK